MWSLISRVPSFAFLPLLHTTENSSRLGVGEGHMCRHLLFPCRSTVCILCAASDSLHLICLLGPLPRTLGEFWTLPWPYISLPHCGRIFCPLQLSLPRNSHWVLELHSIPHCIHPSRCLDQTTRDPQRPSLPLLLPCNSTWALASPGAACGVRGCCFQ